MSKRTASIVALVCCACVVVVASAATAATSGFYVGGGAGSANTSIEEGNYCYYYYANCDGFDYSTGDEDTAFTVHGGFRFGPHFAVEVGYLNAGAPEWSEGFVYLPELDDVFDNFVELNLEAAQLCIVGILPFANVWEVYAKAGVSYWWADADQLLVRTIDGEPIERRVDDEDADLLIGIGVGFSFTPRWHLRAEFQSFGIESDLLNADDDASLDTILVELQFRPGWR